ncbi:hypothetical protein MKK88_01065 [Methylobacterium sp. E-005]|uniref:hypothetical protein n=1 Tax=Methylobacterium sp. E-005 TaxID=2836549 RepID=UPI001FBB9380|nr:hypothetical protein [Methylobacterium sp. E-005]MCJ2084586.1 hypothetical protein [Methylobacterium sp. E-005]
MRVAVHNHTNARKLCEVEISDEAAASLARPPALRDNWVQMADGQMANLPRPEDHVVTIGSGTNVLRLFPATVNGVDMIMTNTPEAALARAAG